jgi:DNA repair photolyase
MVVSSGAGAIPRSTPTNLRSAADSYNASSTPGSDRLIVAVVFGSPLLPGITDNQEAMDSLARRASAVGASFFAAHPLFLKPCSRPTYLSFVREHFPSLQADYAKRFATADFAGKAYREKLAKMVDIACSRHGLRQRSSDALLTRNAGDGRVPPQRIQRISASVQKRLFA